MSSSSQILSICEKEYVDVGSKYSMSYLNILSVMMSHRKRYIITTSYFSI
jgi:hypothetical protein